jgi:Uma2 family endonuclease
MPTVAHKLTLAEFEAQYACEKPYYEFWFGEAVQKSVPDSVHGLLQGILMNLLGEAGYKAASEVKLKIEVDFHPLPDVIASKARFEIPYPTKAVEIVVEILSDDDPMSRVLTKYRYYRDWGFEHIYVVDPAARLVFRWLGHSLKEVDVIAGLPVSRIWSALDSEIE